MFEHFGLYHWLSAASYALLAFSYALRDIKWLRIVAISGCVVDLFLYYGIRPGQPQWGQLGLTVAIILINLVQLYLLYRESRPIEFGEEGTFLHAEVFAGLTPGELKRLLRIGEFDALESGAQVTRKDSPIEKLYVLISGEMEVRAGDVVLAKVTRPGSLIGDIGYMTGMPASADVTAAIPSRVFVLPVKAVDRLRTARPDLHVKLTGILSGGMAEKLRIADTKIVSRLQQQGQAG